MSWKQDLDAARGVVRWRLDVPVPELEEHVTGTGRTCVVLDGSDVEDKAGFLVLCEQAFALPEWFGRNWDALEECLADLESATGTVVVWTGWEDFAENEPDEYATAVDVFSDTARRFAADGSAFAVLLVGEGDDEADGLDLDDVDEADDLDDADDDLDVDDGLDDEGGDDLEDEGGFAGEAGRD